MDVEFDLKRTILLTLFCQNDWISAVTGQDSPDALDVIARAQGAARRAGMEVWHMAMTFDPEFLVVGPLSNFHETGLKFRHSGILGTTGAAFHAKSTPRSKELTLHSPAPTVWGTPLEEALRGRDITTIVVTGIATQNAIKHLVVEATNRFYEVIVLRDCCMPTRNTEAEAVVLDHLFPRISTVATSQDFERALSEIQAAAG